MAVFTCCSSESALPAVGGSWSVMRRGGLKIEEQEMALSLSLRLSGSELGRFEEGARERPS